MTNCDFSKFIVNLSIHLIAGVPGFAAWVGIEVLGDPKPGSNVFISAASGAVGINAGQLAKIRGCRVIGSTGSDDKVTYHFLLFVSLKSLDHGPVRCRGEENVGRVIFDSVASIINLFITNAFTLQQVLLKLEGEK